MQGNYVVSIGHPAEDGTFILAASGRDLALEVFDSPIWRSLGARIFAVNEHYQFVDVTDQVVN